jgi:hypothetical protein
MESSAAAQPGKALSEPEVDGCEVGREAAAARTVASSFSPAIGTGEGDGRVSHATATEASNSTEPATTVKIDWV